MLYYIIIFPTSEDLDQLYAICDLDAVRQHPHNIKKIIKVRVLASDLYVMARSHQ